MKIKKYIFGIFLFFIPVNAVAQESMGRDSIQTYYYYYYYKIVEPDISKLTQGERFSYHYKKLSEVKSKKDTVAIILHLSSLTYMNGMIKEFGKADEFANQLEELLSEVKHKQLKKNIYHALADHEALKANKYRNKSLNSGILQTHQDSFYVQKLKGIEWLKKSVHTLETESWFEQFPREYYTLGQKFLFMRGFDETYVDSAIINLRKAIHYAKNEDQIHLIASAHNWLGTAFRPQRLDSAIYHLTIADSLIRIIEKGEDEDTFWLNYNNTNFLFSALALNEGLDTLIILRNKLLKYRTDMALEDYKNEVANSESEYRVGYYQDEKEKTDEALALEQAKVNQRNLILGIVALLLLGSIGGGIFFYRLNRKNKLLAENNALLVKEQNHRVKNNLQMISSLLSLQANQVEGDSKESMLDGSRRVQAIALLHRKLYDDLEGVKEVNIKEFAEELVEDLLFASGKQHIPVKLNLEPVTLSVEKSVHLALILNELITNSIKHVFSKPQLNGECLELSVSEKASEILIQYRDNSGSFDRAAFEKSDSLGNQIIKSQSKYLSKNWSVKDEHGFSYELSIS